MAEEINYRVETASLATTRTIRYSPIKGMINSAMLHYPDGCDGLVEIIINHGTNQILPAPVAGGTGDLGIALDDVTTQPFAIHKPIEQRDILEVVIINHDDANAHTLSVIIQLDETQRYTGG
jgi:hypothetical protein